MRIASAVIALLLAATASADPLEHSWELRLQQDLGGVTLASVPYTDGSTDDLTTGTYVSFMGGGSLVPLRVGAHALELSGALGMGSWSTGPDNTDDRLRLERFPFELLAGYRFDVPSLPLALTLGGGVQYQFVGDVYGTGSLEGLQLAIDDSPGWIAELRGVYDVFSFHLRYTGRTYHLPQSGLDLDASSVGIGFGIVFPRVAPRTP